MKRTECSACGYDDLQVFLDLGMSPLADAYTERADDLQPTYPLQVAVCTGCWLAQLLEVVPGDELFGTGYSFYSSASLPLSNYHGRYAMELLQRDHALVERGVVEVGCNDGDFLRHLAQPGVPALGVDPATGPVKRAREWNLNVIDEAFNLSLARELVDGFVQKPGLVVLNHVLAHVEDVSDVLAGAAELVASDGAVYVEVQYLPDLLLNNAFDLVYHEHRNFFSLTSLSNALGEHGLYVSEVTQTDRQGGSLRVRATVRREECLLRDYLLTREAWLRDLVAYRGFQGRAERVRDRLLDLLPRGRAIMGFGAPAKATTLLHFCGLDWNRVSHVTDTTEAKQGRYIPNTGIAIQAPYAGAWHEQTVLLLAWNYAADVLKRDLGVEKWIVPLPVPTVL